MDGRLVRHRADRRRTVPVLGADTNAPVAPPLLSGHGLQGQGQAGARRDDPRALHKKRRRRRHGHRRGTEAVLRADRRHRHPAFDGRRGHPAHRDGHRRRAALPGHSRLCRGTSRTTSWSPCAPAPTSPHSRSCSRPSSRPTYGGVVLPVQRPAEIADYQSMGTAPVILACALVLGALSSLLLTLMSSVRRRRRDLALLKTLGFTRRQLSATVAWQSTAAIAVGAVVGIPPGHRARPRAVGPVRRARSASCRSRRSRRTVALIVVWRAGRRQRGRPSRLGRRPHPRRGPAARGIGGPWPRPARSSQGNRRDRTRHRPICGGTWACAQTVPGQRDARRVAARTAVCCNTRVPMPHRYASRDRCLPARPQQHVTTVSSARHVITGFYLRPRRMRRARPGEREESSPCSFTPCLGQRRSPHACGSSGPTP